MSRQRLYPVFLPQAGCRQRCSYCRQEVTGGSATIVNPAQAIEWLDRTLPTTGEGEIAFYGGSFTLLPVAEQEVYLNAAIGYVRTGRVRGIRLSTRPDAVDAAVVARLRAAGVTTVELGCQSFDADILKTVRRGHDPQAASIAVALLHEAGIRVGLHLMPGLPGGDEAEALTSLRVALAQQPDFLRIHPTVVLQGTELADWTLSGFYTPWSLERAVEVCARMYAMCRRVGMLVARMGLQETESLAHGAVMAGPHHPAFGQLVRSRLWYDALLRSGETSGERVWQVHPHDLSDALGHGRDTLRKLQARFGEIFILGNPDLPRDTFFGNGQTWSLFHVTFPGSQDDN